MRSVWRNYLGTSLSLALAALVFLNGCNREERFTESARSEFFLQDFNPEYLDVLWQVDTRSQMSLDPAQKARLGEEARKFFVRLDAMVTSQYRMAFVNHDIDTRFTIPGELQPRGSAQIIEKNRGTLSERVNLFNNLFANSFNLQTGGTNAGLASVRSALSTSFVSAVGVPLVLVTISDSDDRSPVPAGTTDAADYFAQQYLSLKQNKKDQLRVYSVNYVKTGARCFTPTNADIDVTTGPYAFQDRFFGLVDKLQGGKLDICSSWADTVDLTGLKLKDLPSRFRLKGVPLASSIRVLVFDANQTYPATFQFDAAANEVVFTSAPPAGTTIQVTYNIQ